MSDRVNPYLGSGGGKEGEGVNAPSPLFLCISKTVTCAFETLSRTPRAIYSVTSLPEMSTWRRGNRKYILGNQRKVVCPILNLPIKSNRSSTTVIFSLNMMLAWFLDVTLHRKCIWLTHKLQKWTEMYGQKMWLRNVRHPSRTCRFCS